MVLDSAFKFGAERSHNPNNWAVTVDEAGAEFGQNRHSELNNAMVTPPGECG